MKVIFFITKSQPDVIRRIFEYLGLGEKSRPPPEGRQITTRQTTWIFDKFNMPVHTCSQEGLSPNCGTSKKENLRPGYLKFSWDIKRLK